MKRLHARSAPPPPQSGRRGPGGGGYMAGRMPPMSHQSDRATSPGTGARYGGRPKNLSGKSAEPPQLPVDDQRGRELDETQVRAGALLPTGEHATEAVEPRMRHLDDPAA